MKANVQKNVHWTVMRSPNTLFTGRKSILEQLKNDLRDAIGARNPEKQCRIVVTGMGGQGKSEICLQLAHSMRPLYVCPVSSKYLMLTNGKFLGGLLDRYQYQVLRRTITS